MIRRRITSKTAHTNQVSWLSQKALVSVVTLNVTGQCSPSLSFSQRSPKEFPRPVPEKSEVQEKSALSWPVVE